MDSFIDTFSEHVYANLANFVHLSVIYTIVLDVSYTLWKIFPAFGEFKNVGVQQS